MNVWVNERISTGAGKASKTYSFRNQDLLSRPIELKKLWQNLYLESRYIPFDKYIITLTWPTHAQVIRSLWHSLQPLVIKDTRFLVWKGYRTSNLSFCRLGVWDQELSDLFRVKHWLGVRLEVLREVRAGWPWPSTLVTPGCLPVIAPGPHQVRLGVYYMRCTCLLPSYSTTEKCKWNLFWCSL